MKRCTDVAALVIAGVILPIGLIVIGFLVSRNADHGTAPPEPASTSTSTMVNSPPRHDHPKP